jgi:hypothetical protein
MRRRLFTTALACAGVAGAMPPRCDVCQTRLGRHYWTYKDKTCCSSSCVDQLRPTCGTCKSRIRGEHVAADGQPYCNENCLKTTLPQCVLCKKPIQNGFTVASHNYCSTCVKKSPTCFSCGLPAAFPARLQDGRDVCNNCMRWSVKSQEMAQRHYERALRNLQAWTKLELASVPKLELIDRARMQALSGQLRKTDSPVSIRGLYSRQVTITRKKWLGFWQEENTDTTETIYIVDHLHDEVFRTAATHELMHDLLHEHFPRLESAPLWVHEGICQQAAAEYCRRRNYSDILHGIEHCEDPDYGDGYRYINQLAGFDGWSALRHWMETVDVATLPATAPHSKSDL